MNHLSLKNTDTNPPKDIVKDIEKDVPRTFAGHKTRVNTVHGQAALNLLLRANAVYVVSVLECQLHRFTKNII